MIQKIAHIHKISLGSSWHLCKEQLIEAFIGHDCVNCNLYTSILEAQLAPSLKKKQSLVRCNKKNNARCKLNCAGGEVSDDSIFPPHALSEDLSETIVRDWCKATDSSSLEEAGCAVCGELVPVKQLSHLKAIKTMLGILAAPGVTQIECKSSAQSIAEFRG
ncbi:hypothetical protein L208DRAFT_1351669, partial [Tricholoma matsutake]